MERKLYKNSEENDRKIALALAEIMKTTPFHEISVINVCEKAGVSKNTFYRHYKNLSDILYKKLEEITEKTLKKISPPSDFYQTCFISCQVWYSERELFSAFIQDEVAYIIKNNIKKCTEKTFAYANIKNWDDGLFVEYFSSVFCMMLKWWAGRDFEDSPEKIAGYIVDYLSGKPLKQMQERL